MASTTRVLAWYINFFSDLVGFTHALVLVLIVKIIIRKIQSVKKKIKEFLLFFYFFDNVSYQFLRLFRPGEADFNWSFRFL